MSKEKKSVEKENNTEEIQQAETVEQTNEEPTIENVEQESQVEKLTKELESVKDASLRLRADFENYKRRNNEATRVAYVDGAFDAIKSLLPVIDSFDRATKIDNPDEGLVVIKKQFDNILSGLGVKEIEAQGKDFDPKYHNAVMQCEDEENSGKVVEVFEKGYVYKEKILRYSMVKVAK